jgi:hypothetical protein
VIYVKFLELYKDEEMVIPKKSQIKLQMLEPHVFIERHKKTDKIVGLIVELETDYEFKRNKDLIYLKVFHSDTIYFITTGKIFGKCKMSEYILDSKNLEQRFMQLSRNP